MFSRTERAYLQLLAEGTTERASGVVESRFPNPAYRRKLMWGIRQKASNSLADWQLYATAARRESRLLPREVSPPDGERPVFADPLVTLFDDFRRKLGRRRAPPKDPDPPRGPE